jgi:hypothetical protein
MIPRPWTRVGDLMLFINVLWSAPLQTIGYLGLLYYYIGWASIGVRPGRYHPPRRRHAF